MINTDVTPAGNTLIEALKPCTLSGARPTVVVHGGPVGLLCADGFRSISPSKIKSSIFALVSAPRTLFYRLDCRLPAVYNCSEYSPVLLSCTTVLRAINDRIFVIL